MELKPGYKQTEVGVIPEDWSVVRLSVLISELNAGVSVNSVDEKLGLYGHTESVLKTSCILDGYFFPEECKKILPGDIGRAKLNPTKDSIVISRMNTPALVGECGYVDKDYSYLFLPDRLWQTIIRKEAGVNVRWLAYLLSFGQFSKAIKDTATGTSGSMKNISKEIFLGLQVVFPDRREQTAIANALSDADALIQSLTRLIAKKRQIKQGAMQTLLNPYENGQLKEGWYESPLREVSYMKGRIGWQGLKQTEFTMNEEEPFLITGMNFKDGEISWNEVYHISYERYEIAKDIQLKPNDVLMTKDGTIGKLLYVNDIPYPGKASLNSHLLVFRPMRNSYDPRFLYHQLSSKVFRDYIEISKSGSTFFGLSQEAVGNYLFKFPKPEEQTRIATILSDMDTEIAALEAKLAKYRHIKQGMMQNLLTGRIRLI